MLNLKSLLKSLLSLCLSSAVITPAGSFGLFAGIGTLTWLFAYFQLPELSGVSLNDVHSAMSGVAQENNRGYTDIQNRGEENEEQDPHYVIE